MDPLWRDLHRSESSQSLIKQGGAKTFTMLLTLSKALFDLSQSGFNSFSSVTGPKVLVLLAQESTMDIPGFHSHCLPHSD